MTNNESDEDELDYLAKIEQHLRSIRSAVNFFVFLVVISLILGGCGILLSIGR